jgi:hypothetical protein
MVAVLVVLMVWANAPLHDTHVDAKLSKLNVFMPTEVFAGAGARCLRIFNMTLPNLPMQKAIGVIKTSLCSL